LIEERLEGVVVVAVEQHDLGVCALELLRCTYAGEASAEDDNAWTCARHRLYRSAANIEHAILAVQGNLLTATDNIASGQLSRSRRPPRGKHSGCH
jgi:hypothetical protein